jgi:serine/threonine-protein kinase RsbW
MGMVGKDRNGLEVITLSIPSRLELLPVLDRLVQGIAEQMDFNEDDVNAIAISVIEAGTNAIQHGHGQDPTKIVAFRFDLHPDYLEILVQDAGPGFDVAKMLSADPTRPEDLMKSHGRGIYIMLAMMDHVDFNVEPNQGTRVFLTKHKRSNGKASASS